MAWKLSISPGCNLTLSTVLSPFWGSVHYVVNRRTGSITVKGLLGAHCGLAAGGYDLFLSIKIMDCNEMTPLGASIAL